MHQCLSHEYEPERVEGAGPGQRNGNGHDNGAFQVDNRKSKSRVFLAAQNYGNIYITKNPRAMVKKASHEKPFQRLGDIS